MDEQRTGQQRYVSDGYIWVPGLHARFAKMSGTDLHPDTMHVAVRMYFLSALYPQLPADVLRAIAEGPAVMKKQRVKVKCDHEAGTVHITWGHEPKPPKLLVLEGGEE
tara:strand:- start:1477 stop:1800 length:324 start_codon:yes stop_codon:yes gene_type:complete